MKIIQILPTLAYGDAIGNDVMAIDKALKELGFHTDIFAENIDERMLKFGIKKTEDLPKMDENDIAMLHLSIGADCNYRFAGLKCKKVVRYHNVTPPQFFRGISSLLEKICRWALESVEYLADKVDYCIADSEFNKLDLIEMGYACPIDVMPILIKFQDYEQKPDSTILKRYQDKDVVLFTGRIAPNKKIEDIISCFSMYKRYYNPDAILVFVGRFDPGGVYYKKLMEFIKRLGVRDIVFTDHIRFDEILSYYHVAKVFLCQSEHEGFCVPLVEAMYFNIPVIAYNCCAIPYTMGESGIVMDTKEPAYVAGMLHRVIQDQELRKQIINGQRERLKDFGYDVIKEQLRRYLNNVIENNR